MTTPLWRRFGLVWIAFALIAGPATQAQADEIWVAPTAQPATTHVLTVAQLRRWVDGVAVSPDETLKKRRLKALLV